MDAFQGSMLEGVDCTVANLVFLWRVFCLFVCLFVFGGRGAILRAEGGGVLAFPELRGVLTL